MTVIVHLLTNCVIITGFFFSTKRVQWCEEDSLPSFVAFLSARNWMLKEQLLWKIYSFQV